MKRLQITRRDFLNGFALSVAAGTSLSPLQILAQSVAAPAAYYPPELTGMRGNHPGAFEVAHAVARNGASYPRPREMTDVLYDLVIVGGGLSGLAAACFYRQRVGPRAKILVLDNHDDFGGHAKRNEFTVDGQHLIGYGGSQSIEAPASYSPVAAQLLKAVGIDTRRFYDYFDSGFFARHGLGSAIHFSREAYEVDRTVTNVLPSWGNSADPAEFQTNIDAYPIAPESREALLRLLRAKVDYLGDRPHSEKIALLRRTSYSDFLQQHCGMPQQVALLVRDIPKGLWGVGLDALSALEGLRMGMPGTGHIDIGELAGDRAGHDEPYIFHFPDGNAGIARSLVRSLLPHAVPGTSMEDLVAARVDYALLDRPSANTRIRLNSTAVDVRHTPQEKAVDVTYLIRGEVRRVRGKHAILACNNNLIPHICPELPEAQKQAIGYATKVPLVYINVAMRNWQAFARIGAAGVYVPQARLMHSFGLDFPVSMGGYRYTQRPSEPTVVHGSFVPTEPDKGLSARQQHKAGRERIYQMSFDDFETGIVEQLQAALAGGEFDAERDIAAITVNRWPHGYAYEYNDYSDAADWGPQAGPHIAGRARIGRISIANSDASAYAYADGAIDAADRAVQEQIDFS